MYGDDTCARVNALLKTTFVTMYVKGGVDTNGLPSGLYRIHSMRPVEGNCISAECTDERGDMLTLEFPWYTRLITHLAETQKEYYIGTKPVSLVGAT